MMADDTQAGGPRHVRAGEGAPVWAMGSLFEMKLTAVDTAGALGIAQVTQPTGIATPLHRHHNEAEVFVVLEGALLYEADGALHELAAGSTMYLPRGVPHRFVVTETARMLVIACPGRLLDLYHDVGTPANDRVIPTDLDPSEIDRWNATASRYGLEVLGPPLRPNRLTHNGTRSVPNR
jgi:quercetin dioxygenase-like cupin family protein